MESSFGSSRGRTQAARSPIRTVSTPCGAQLPGVVMSHVGKSGVGLSIKPGESEATVLDGLVESAVASCALSVSFAQARWTLYSQSAHSHSIGSRPHQ